MSIVKYCESHYDFVTVLDMYEHSHIFSVLIMLTVVCFSFFYRL